jgi:hypothetical protein
MDTQSWVNHELILLTSEIIEGQEMWLVELRTKKTAYAALWLSSRRSTTPPVIVTIRAHVLVQIPFRVLLRMCVIMTFFNSFTTSPHLLRKTWCCSVNQTKNSRSCQSSRDAFSFFDKDGGGRSWPPPLRRRRRAARGLRSTRTRTDTTPR